jgi:hypothetical protein
LLLLERSLPQLFLMRIYGHRLFYGAYIKNSAQPLVFTVMLQIESRQPFTTNTTSLIGSEHPSILSHPQQWLQTQTRLQERPSALALSRRDRGQD